MLAAFCFHVQFILHLFVASCISFFKCDVSEDFHQTYVSSRNASLSKEVLITFWAYKVKGQGIV